jgi:hypothetical protein
LAKVKVGAGESLERSNPSIKDMFTLGNIPHGLDISHTWEYSLEKTMR